MMFKNEDKGQGSIEFLFLISFGIILALLLTNSLAQEYDLTLSILAAKNGVTTGLDGGRLSVFEKSAYNKYKINNSVLTHPNSIKLVKIETIDRGYDSRYNRTSIQIKAFVSSSSVMLKGDRTSTGDRINFNLRKSITMTFGTSNLTNTLHNPCFSNHHVYTTANVQWV